MKRLVAIALVIAGCSSGGTAVDLTIDASRLGGVLGAVTQMSVSVDADSHYTRRFDVSKVIAGGQVRVPYRPGVKAGVLVFAATAERADGSIVASGRSMPVMLVAGRSVLASIELGSSGGVDMAQPAQPAQPSGVDAGTIDDGSSSSGGDMAASNRCTSSSQCTTGGGCVDGYCCDKPCNDACHACNLPGLAGVCSPVSAGKMPASGHPTCGPDPVASCMRDGTCDGAGSCRIAPGGTVCGAATCNSGSNVFTAASTCDGNGKCIPGSSITCAPYVCASASACYMSCSGSSTGCVAGQVCNAGSCGLKVDGAQCSGDGECQHGHCVDGVCCNSTCGATCYSCNQQQFLGQCHVTPSGQDPRSSCPAGKNADLNCSPGGCNGAGACTQTSNGTPCQAGSCSGVTEYAAGTCESGACSVPSTGTSCIPYICGATSCLKSCSSPSQCASVYWCVGGSCVDCRPASSSADVFVDPVNGSDDIYHGGGEGGCAYKTIGYALMQTSGRVCPAASGNYASETYPFYLSRTQVIDGDCGRHGVKPKLGTGSNTVIFVKADATNVAIQNCEIFASKSVQNCIFVTPGLGSATVAVSGNNIHDCGSAINGNGNAATAMTIIGNSFSNMTYGLESVGNSTVSNNSFSCSGGGDAIDTCAGTMTGSGNSCSSCGIDCNSCGTGNCYNASFWSKRCP
jgi:hypothetical protein